MSFAVPLFTKASFILEDADLLTRLGICENKFGNYDKALKYYEKCLAIKLKTLGGEHPSVASSYNNIGKCYDALNKKELALDYFIQSAEIRKEHPGVGLKDESTKTSIENIKRIAKKLGKENELPEWMKNLQF